MSDRVQLGSLVKLSTESAKDPAAVGLTRSVGLDHIDSDDLRLRRWSDIGNGADFTRVFRAGDVLFGKRRSYQRKVALADFDGVCSGDILVVRSSDPRLDGLYLAYLLASPLFIGHAISSSAGSLSPRIRPRDLERFEFDLPSLDEQRRVVEVMRAVDREIEAAEVAQSSSRTFLAGFVLKELAAIDPSPLHKVATLKRGYSYKSSEYGSDGLSFITIKAISKEGVIRREGLKRFNASVDLDPGYLAQPGSLLVGLVDLTPARRILGAPILVPDGITAAYSSDLVRLYVNEQSSNEFMFYALQTSEARAFVEAHHTGSTVAHLSTASVKDLPVRVPALIEDQLRLTKSFREIEKISESSDETLVHARALRTSLLQELIG
jgi:type I restriction enzyme, S subunit